MNTKSNLRKLDYNLPFVKFVEELNEIDRAMELALGRKNRSMDAEGKYFPYIPNLERTELYTSLLINPTEKFLDVGCGTGRILALRKYLTGSDVVGVEINPDVAGYGRIVYGVSIIVGDAFEVLTKSFMERIGVIYSYMPIRDYNLMRKLEMHIEDIARDRAIRIEMLPGYINSWTGGRTAIFEITDHRSC